MGTQRKKRFLKWLSLTLVLALIVPFFNYTSAAAENSPNVSIKDNKQQVNNKVNQDLIDLFADQKEVTYLVKMKEQGDTKKAAQEALSKAEDSKASLTAQQMKRVKASAVVTELRSTAIETQQQLKKLLTEAEKQGSVSSFQSYYIVNAMAVTSNEEVMKKIAVLPEVEKILPNRTRQLNPQVEGAVEETKASLTKATDKAETNNTEWNIDRVGAPQVWSETGIDGSGVVVANIDTGVEWDHPALKEKYRGFDPANPDTADHEFNWFDATAGQGAPYDDHGHGTHTMGTMVGAEEDGSNQVGVAPGSKWIGVKAFTAAGGTDVDLLEAGEWILAPKDDDGNPHPEQAPDVVNNSWGGGPGLDEWYRPMVQNWRESGIVPVFSAGNDGPGDGTIAAPSNYPESIAVGATTATDGLASFSSRGPSPYDGEIKPDISAPGANVRSSVPGGGYEGGWNGTSMAGPHVAGTAALLLQADNSLSVDDLEELMLETADTTTNDQYPEDPNEGYGHGIVNAYTAVSAVVSGIGEIKGYVYEEGEDDEAPSIEHESPSETYEGVPLTLVADVSDNVSVSTVELSYRIDQRGTWETFPADLVDGDYLQGTYQTILNGEDISGSQLHYKWVVSDFGGNEVESDTYEVAIKDAITIGYEQDFETIPSGWLSFGENNSWEWGVPEDGPESAGSGEKVYGTNLTGDYDNNSDMTLIMPPVEVPEGETYLQFQTWYNLENNYDYGHVVVSTDMENWEQLAEYNGTTDGWITSEVNLSSYAGQNVFVGFHVDTDYSVTREGLFIDDVALTDQSSGSSATTNKQSTKKSELGVVDKGSAKMKKPVNAKKLLPGEVIEVQVPQYKEKGKKKKEVQPNVLPLDATVTVVESDRSVSTNPADGSYRLMHAAGDFTVVADAYGFHPSEQSVSVPEDGSVSANFTLNPIATGTLEGTVTNEQTGEPIEGATLMLIEDAAVAPVETGENGTFTLEAYEGDYTLRVMAPSYHGEDVPVTIEGGATNTVEVELAPFIGYPGEIGYDDGTAENARAFYDAGNGWAVKMSLEEGQESAMVTGGLFRFWTEEWPVPGGNEFQVEVYDATGTDGAPGEKIGGPYEAEALRNGEWTHVDLSDKGIVANGDFYMVYIQTQPNPYSPGLATDEDGDYADRSWQLVGGSWSKSPEAEGNYMIRALVDYAAEAPVIESPADGSYTNQESITVEGSAAPTTTVTVYNDGEEAGTTGATEDGSFAVDITLETGENELTAISSMDNGSTEPSAPVVVTLDQDNPVLTIDTPTNGDKTNKEVITVAGQVEEENLDRVEVNGQTADVDEDGAYSKRIMLSEGENEIVVTATDLAGNSAEESVTVDAKFNATDIENLQPTEDKYMQAGESVKIEFDAGPGLDATFYIRMPLTNFSDQATELPMMETEEGHYVGYWTATSNLVAEGAEIVVKAADDYGNVAEEAAEGKLYINTEE
ncbi:S8 family serine peptidase [Thalassobacillus devorans]|uniref:S8 family serine peptidase n=1 Tax=Thalassobacillus devorans TaxID=279813 RepID=UPI000A1CB1B6|nr:S8 family serine peptidase [Thalassobacillus devorans]